MDRLTVEGGSPLFGSVRVSGAKNAALPLMAASILADGPLELGNVPSLGDLKTMAKLLVFMGGSVRADFRGDPGAGPEECKIDMRGLSVPEARHELVKTMRASALVLGPLVARHGRASVSLPGGCAIGVRPIDMHLRALKEMGADFDISAGDIVARAPDGGLRGAAVNFPQVTVTGTENVMMAAALARGETVISNAAREPEVVDTGRCLEAMGAKIDGLGTGEITVQGVTSLSAARHTVMADRIEAGTLMAAVALAGGKVTLQGAPLASMAAVRDKFGEAGLHMSYEGDDLYLESPGGRLEAVNLVTMPHPGFPTDMQAQFMAAMCLASGVSIVTETIFENRFMHVAELRRLGADITLEGRSAIVKGVRHLSGAPLTASDLRASAGLLLAALAARGRSVVSRVYHLDRGYDRLDQKLNLLGARITRERE
ncbi:MAG: UDP-N-acetylglucosamine 1-carboxyvinyltransferase [Deltaproteobacteria bacterium]|nr:UDP-N-acetylglucosamine 1-carboxyvinyltransferase [Deltaproteobacteria bacterium]